MVLYLYKFYLWYCTVSSIVVKWCCTVSNICVGIPNVLGMITVADLGWFQRFPLKPPLANSIIEIH